ncbi:MAG: helix-turn-helix domain-containing protein [Aequoribacter sp.]|uniref:helix-turn-helix domain-containing protein n=1 Tax=Aequoribacter sp. TaxID=2847771 RepID=UPI003C3F44D0
MRHEVSITRCSCISHLRIQSIKYMRDKGLGIRKIASELSVGVGTVYKVLDAHPV